MADHQKSLERNTALMHRLVFDMQEKGDADLIDELLHPEFVDRTAHGDGPHDRNNMKTVVKNLHSAFKDIKIEIIHCVAQENVVATNKVLRGRQVEDFMGHVASGKMVELPIMDFVTYQDGLIREHWARAGPIRVLE